MKLYFQKFGEGRPLIILHGLFGMSDNWHTLGKKLSEQYCVYLPDLRNHGRSPHAAEMNYDLMAEDVRELIQDENLSHPLLIGHSMGGKTAMQLALKHPEILSGLIVIDITAAPYPMYHGKLIEILKRVSLVEAKERRDIDDTLKNHIEELAVAQLMMKNIRRDDAGQFQWKLNLDSIEKNLAALHEEISGGRFFQREALLLCGEHSPYVNEETIARTKRLFPLLRVKEIKGAGHWVHADRPEETLEEILHFCRETGF